MNLYLSSYHIGDSGRELRRLRGTGRAFVISNALDFSPDIERRQNSLAREIDDLAGWGIASEPLDLRDFFGRSDLLQKRLEDATMLWVVGGNTFLLRRAMALSGLDLILQAKKCASSFLYAGYSAGACVLCPSLGDSPRRFPTSRGRRLLRRSPLEWIKFNRLLFCSAFPLQSQ